MLFGPPFRSDPTWSLMAASVPLHSAPLQSLITEIPNKETLNEQDVSNSSSTASSVLIQSTNPHTHQANSTSDRRSSSSSFSSTGSQRVRIKAKYLREVKSPFEADEEKTRTDEEFVPPILPKNLPQGRDIEAAFTEDSPVMSNGRREKADPVRVPSGGSVLKVDAPHESAHKGPISHPKPSSFGSLLKQGAPTSGHTAFSLPSGPGTDVRITQFAAGGKQRVFKEQLLKRQEISGPVKRYVRPTMVVNNPGTSQASAQEPASKTTQDVSDPNAVAAVTAAAVAATLPIVKAQSDLESKLDVMMERLGHLHELTNKAQQLPVQQQPATASLQQGDLTGDPQRNLDDIVSRRLLHLEKIQERQLEWQERFLMRDQHPAQRHESLRSPIEPTRLGRAPVDLTQRQNAINGVRSGMTIQSAPVRDTAQQSHVPVGQHEGKSSLHGLQQGFDQNGRHVPQSEDRVSAEDHKYITENQNQETERKSQKRRHYTPAVTLHRHASQRDPFPKQNLQSEAVPSSDNDADIGLGNRREKPSPLDTPAPRRHAPQPLTQNPPPKITRTGRGLLEEILTSHDEEERRLATRGRQTHTPPTAAARGLASPQSGAETKAASLVQQLGKLKKEMREMKTDLLQNLHSGGAHVKFDPGSGHLPSSRGHSEIHEEAEKEWDKLIQRRLQPAPADIYLRKPPPLPVSYPAAVSTKQPLSPSQYNAPVHSSLCTEAKAVLDKVQSSRAHLESNLETVIRAKEQEEFYNYLDSLHQEGEAAEKAKLRYKVGRMIAMLDEELKHEFNKPKKPQPSVHIPEKDSTVPTAQPLKAGGRKKPVSARIDSGLRRGQPPAAAEKARAREKHNKENVSAIPKKQPASRVKKPHPVDHNQDEAYLTRVYGKALYQARRSTMQKEPYLKYATASPQAKPARTPSATQVKGTEMKSARIQTEPSSRTIQIPRPAASQFYFDPYPVVPMTSGPHPQTDANPSQPGLDQQPAPLTAPSHGQLIPMAVPLGPPQMGGLAQPVTIQTEGLETGVIRDLERREIRTNVAVVNVESKTKPKLTVQHLPAVDIDTAPPSAASSIIEYGPAHDTGTQQDTRADITQPDDDNLPGVKGPPQFSHYLAVSDSVEPKEESEDELPVPGISLPGHYTETTQRYHGPPFPPQAPPADPSWARPSSDQLAGDIRRDIMENTAMEWVERELMARIISELYSRPPAVEQRPVSPDPSLDSSTNESIVETIGPAGLQLFVDAGQAVDRTLVNALVREVLEEKVATALGQHDRDVPRQQPTSTLQEALTDMTIKSPIPTPVVTPKASPVHTPPRVASRVATPVASPSEASPAESETDSVKEPLPTHDTTTADETIPAPSAPVATPINTPPPSPPPSIDTPVSSLRESPKLISVIDGSVITPVRTPEPISPEPVEEEQSVELPPSPEPVPVIEELPPPTPTPSLPTPSTPTPSPSSVTTTQPTPSTETAGQTISEGEWLISAKSEGQVDNLTENEPGAVAMGNLSTSSSIDGTLMGAEDLEKDVQDDDKLSEGEISPAKHTPRLHSSDPVVALLAHMRQRPDPLAGPSGLLPPQLAVSQTTLNDTKSLGEISVGQCPALTPSSEQLLFKEAYGAKPPEVIMPRPEGGSRSLGEVGTASEDQPETERQPVDDSTLRVSHLDGREHQEPTHRVDSPLGDQEAAQAAPHPAPRIIQVVGKSLSPEPPRKEDEQQPFREASRQDPADVEGVTDAGGTEEDNVGGDKPFTSRAPIPTNLFGTQTMSDLGTRTLTPDALNLEALLQSGYLSQTFSQSEAGTSDFESTRPGQTGGWAGASGTPFGATQTFTEDSLERSDRKDPVAKTGRAMSFSVTLPSAAESQGLDLSQTISEGEIPAAETTSDISEISGGPL